MATRNFDRIVNLCITTNVQIYKDLMELTGLVERSGRYADPIPLYRQAEMTSLNALSL